MLSLLFFGFLVETQAQKITFAYDAAGNQILRTYCTSCRLKDNDEPPKEISELKEEDLQKFFPNDVISYYPNPVREELYLKWELINNNKVLSIEMYSMNGQLIKSYKNTENQNSQLIPFQEYPVGIYFVNLMYSDSTQKTIKIIKK